MARYVLRMKDCQRFYFSANCLGLNGKQVALDWVEVVIKKDLKEKGTSWEDVKRERL